MKSLNELCRIVKAGGSIKVSAKRFNYMSSLKIIIENLHTNSILIITDAQILPTFFMCEIAKLAPGKVMFEFLD